MGWKGGPVQIRYRPNFHLLWPRLAPTHGHGACAVKGGLRVPAPDPCRGRTLGLACRPFPPRGVMISVPSIGDALMLRPEPGRNVWAGEALPPRERVILKVVVAEAAELASS